MNFKSVLDFTILYFYLTGVQWREFLQNLLLLNFNGNVPANGFKVSAYLGMNET